MVEAPPSCEEQRAAVKAVQPDDYITLVPGQTYCVLPASWWKAWTHHVGWHDVSGGPAPGRIDTDALLTETNGTAPPQLAATAVEGEDWVLTTKAAWDLLYGWYGGGSAIERKAIEVGGGGHKPKEVQLELRLMHLTVHIETDDSAAQARADSSSPFVLALSQSQTVGDCIEQICAAWQLPAKQTRLWDYFSCSRRELLDEFQTLGSAGLHSGQDVLLEQQMLDGKWHFTEETVESGASMDLFDGAGSTSGTIATGSGASSSHAVGGPTRLDTVVDTSTPGQPGVVGLTNLGNTCFMNSMLQCLGNVRPLREFFLSKSYERDLNENNPLGTGGELASAFASLLHLMWQNNGSVIAPRSFKSILGHHAPQFSGYSQHDSQELCNYVLDKLHEDVNRVRKKPYVENFEANGEPDAEIIAEVRKRHRLRNSSRIADMFEGFFKSTVVCPVCDKVSVTFDPYMSVALPLGTQDNMRTLTVSLRRLDGTIAPVTVTLKSSSKMEALVAAVAEQSSIPADRLVVADVYNSRFHKLFDHFDQLDRLNELDDIIFAFETEHARVFSSQQACAPTVSTFQDAKEETALCCVALLHKEQKHSLLIGLPLALTVPASTTGAQLYALVGAQLERYRAETTPMEGVSDSSTSMLSVLLQETPQSSSEAHASSSAPVVVPGVVVGATGSSSDDAVPTAWEPMEVEASSVDVLADSCERGWTLHSVRSDCDPPGDPLPSDGDQPLWPANAGREPYTVLVLWDESAFRSAGGYSREKLVRDSAEKSGVPCGKRHVAAARESGMTLRKCFELFSQEEVLDADNAWYCPKCTAHRQGRKRMQFWSLPPVLVAHLKRFSAQGGWRRKLDVHVDFPIENLDLTEFALCHQGGAPGRDVYDLLAVSNHFGSTGGGHYTAFAKNSVTGAWHKFDDSYTSKVEDPASVVTSAAYVLIYVKRGYAIDVPEDSA
ncbi:hypothetical protein AB1Y20_020805 [Prymnesium parvum]|uniref:Ubiquitin carboxyl-terminal hydrolase n=1 Tax=Prymnesium parvum TaxID=97485 RepID=A0AB34JW78_PRYPA